MSDPTFVGLVANVDETRKGPKVWVTALRGQLAEGDEIEIVHSDGSTVRAHFIDVGKHPITPDSYEGKSFKQEGVAERTYRKGDLLRAPDGVPVELDPASAVAGELAAAHAAGATHAPHVPDGVAALHIQHTIAWAAKHSGGAATMVGSFQQLGKVFDLYGLTEQGDRARLIASGAVEGYQPGPGMRMIATAGAGVLGLPTAFEAPRTIQAIGLAMEQGDQFVRSYQKSMAVTGSGIRLPLQEVGRAVARGWCKKCDDVRTLTTKFKCEVCGKESEEYRVVVPADVAASDEEIRAAHAGRKRGLFGR